MRGLGHFYENDTILLFPWLHVPVSNKDSQLQAYYIVKMYNRALPTLVLPYNDTASMD